ncbi:peptidyl-prolyl cis-trans isomerase [Parvularcula lutaonensis]|uniref:Peptidyl-prolyl cis-trans isomerase n=1 Tax=Parvularcula lutaonensis TaxID=491923 RepID=A0ABV7MAU4_9PROT|nr:peptidylprolyl isomerase [Parvularcula lutaonensis]GGY45602.1 hypothetical protein GCM10007148_13270 [Parvularcula lutaonensis]
MDIFRHLAMRPMVQFLVLGAALFLLNQLIASSGTEAVRVSQAALDRRAADFEEMWGSPPDSTRMAMFEAELLRDSLLFRAAVDDGLHLSDGIVRQRLIELQKRRIVGSLPEPTDEEVLDHYAANLGRYTTEWSYSFRHVFFLSEARVPEDAMARLREGLVLEGDPFWAGHSFEAYEASAIRGLAGAGFLEALDAAPSATWTGPVRSARGIHYVFKSEEFPPRQLAFAEVSDAVRQDLLYARAEQALNQRLDALKSRYNVD